MYGFFGYEVCLMFRYTDRDDRMSIYCQEHEIAQALVEAEKEGAVLVHTIYYVTPEQISRIKEVPWN